MNFRSIKAYFFYGFVCGLIVGWLLAYYYLTVSHLSQEEEPQINAIVNSPIEENSQKPLEELSKCDFYVDVAGAVGSPGVYCIKSGQIVNDAISLAGGLNTNIYAAKFVMQQMNFARILLPEDKIYIPFGDDVECKLKAQLQDPSGVNNTKDSILQDNNLKDAICISINKANKDELMELTGIGEAMAIKIIESRPYNKLEDLKNVSGIGDKVYDKLVNDICL